MWIQRSARPERAVGFATRTVRRGAGKYGQGITGATAASGNDGIPGSSRPRPWRRPKMLRIMAMPRFALDRLSPTLFSLVVAAGACAIARPDSAAPDGLVDDVRSADKTTFENPGGKWMPGQMAEHAETLQALGLEFPVDNLGEPTAHPLGAIVSLGGCSASFVSAQGLIVTNHHCVTGALQYNSSSDHNLLEDGFLATTPAQEKSAGPTQRVYVTTGFTDVTSQVLEGLDSIEDPNKRYEEVETRVKNIRSSCEEGRDDTRCRIASYFEGAQFFQIEQLEIRDVRLVYAPHAGIGVFGGETDNWRWPRHTGDFSFLRAYVGKDGKPADYAEDNVPYRPPHHLKVATQPLQPGDLVMVVGYPGRTYRLKTAAEVKAAVDFTYPNRIDLFSETLALLDELGAKNPEIKIKAASLARGRANYLTNSKGMLDGLVKGGLAAQKTQLEADLAAWIDAEPERKKKYGGVLEAMTQIHEASLATAAHDAAVRGVLSGSSLMGVAATIVKMAEERPKKDADRASGFQARDLKRREQRMRRLSQRLDVELDRALFKMYLERALRGPEKDRPDDVLRIVLDKKEGELTAADVDKALQRYYDKTKLADEAVRVRLLKTATTKKLKRSKDPFVKLAFALKPLEKKREATAEARAGQLATLRPRYIEALRTFTTGTLAPDANGTLRITFGTVRGFRPAPDKDVYAPFSTVSEMVAKHQGKGDFNAPESILEAARAKKFGDYADARIRDLPVDFLADLDITGGNSGSATINARGELVGLAFDGNYEAIASDWVFIPALTRSIHVDFRYAMWVMDAVDGADHLLQEMGVEPSL